MGGGERIRSGLRGERGPGIPPRDPGRATYPGQRGARRILVRPMRDHLEAFLDRGGNAAFLRREQHRLQVASRSRPGDGDLETGLREDPLYRPPGGRTPSSPTLWSHPLVGRPENALLGVGFLFGGFHLSHDQIMDGTGAFTVRRPDHWVFAGTGSAPERLRGASPSWLRMRRVRFGRWRTGFRSHRKRREPEGLRLLATARQMPDADMAWFEGWSEVGLGSACLGVLARPGGTVCSRPHHGLGPRVARPRPVGGAHHP